MSEPTENATDLSALTALEELSQPHQSLDERERAYLERHREELRRRRELRHTLERDPWPIRVPVDPWQEDLPVPEED